MKHLNALQDVYKEELINTLDTREENLVKVFEENYLTTFLKNSHDFIVKELDCWQGRADIVLVKTLEEIKINYKQAEALSQLTNSTVVSLLHYKSPRTLDYICMKTGLTSNTIKSSIRELQKADIILRSKSGSFYLNELFIIPRLKFHAYEAKLHNWKRALYQAIQYYGFAESSSVVMPKRYIQPAIKNLESFKRNGIGLISINNLGRTKVILKAQRNQPSKKAFHLVGVGKVIKENYNI